MLKKDLGLLVLIVVVGAIVALINPRFLSSINIANTANLVGLFGLFSIAQGFVIITAGIELSVGSMIALLGVIFIDLIANKAVPWPIAAVLVLAIGFCMGLVHGLLVTRLKLQPFIVTLCGLLIYRGVARFYTQDATAGFPFGVNFPDLEWLTTGRTDIVSVLTGGTVQTILIPHSFFFMLVVAAIMWGGITVRSSAGTSGVSARTRKGALLRHQDDAGNHLRVHHRAVLTALSAISRHTRGPSCRPRTATLRTLRHRGGRARPSRPIVGVVGTIPLQVLRTVNLPVSVLC